MEKAMVRMTMAVDAANVMMNMTLKLNATSVEMLLKLSTAIRELRAATKESEKRMKTMQDKLLDYVGLPNNAENQRAIQGINQEISDYLETETVIEISDETRVFLLESFKTVLESGDKFAQGFVAMRLADVYQCLSSDWVKIETAGAKKK